jgi:hypothetical protein
VEAAARILREMATFDAAGVSEKVAGDAAPGETVAGNAIASPSGG